MKNSKNVTVDSKRFVVRKNLIGKSTIIKVTFKDGKCYEYDHDAAFTAMDANGLTKLACWEKYGSYTASSSLPKPVRDIAKLVK